MLKIKIKELRKTNNLTQQQLADILSVEKTNISKWESGAYEPSKAVLAKMADYFKVSIDYLLGQTDNPSPTEINYPNISAVAKRKIPYLGEIACGKPVFADEEKGVYFDVCSDLKIDFCLKAKGDSMINARIQDGDIVFIREQSMVNNGEIGAVIIGDEATLKRVYYYPEQNRLMLQAENPAYAPLFYEGDELNNIHILGKAVAFQSRL